MQMRSVFALVLLVAAQVAANRAHADSRLAAEYAQIAGSVYTTTVAAASGSDTVAWVTTHRGDVALWVAKGPAYLPRKLLELPGDTGDEINGLVLSPDGRWLTFNRGPSDAPNGRVPNPAGLANGLEDALWVITTRGGQPEKIAIGASSATFAPDSARFVFVVENQVLVSKLKATPPANDFEPATMLFKEMGGIDSLVWSPSGDALAFTSARPGHGLVGVFKLHDRVRYIAPSIDRDVQVSWSLDGRRLAFLRLTGVAAGQVANVMTDTRFAILVADASGSEAIEVYRSPGSDAGIATSDSLHWLKDGRVAYISDADGYSHVYAVDPDSRQVTQLTKGRCDEEAIVVNAAGDALAASGNCFDQDRREVAMLDLVEGAWKRVSADRSIATDPVFVGLGNTLLYRSASYDRAQSPAIGSTGRERLLSNGSTTAQSLELPEIFHLAASDGTPLTAVWFAPRGAPSGSRAPAVVYVHGGPIRQMMPGWHPNPYYAYVYAANQLLARHGVGVLAINYRTGVGFGRAFRNAEGFGPNGLSELQDVIAAGDKLRSIPGIDPARIGIYGGSYGGHLTANALARRSDLFSAGVAWHGIYDFTQWATNVGHPNRLSTAWGNTESTRGLAYQSSALSQVRTWRSPVLLISGDDDRNVDFVETISLYRALEDAHVPVSAFVLPNEVHSFLRFSSWTQVIDRTASFLLAHLSADAFNN
ncbi:MAG TPA: prolyl oligopeptidase family serine peptidase [Steroidobacteraceae bacterium]|nr:prolyl oligopeptidase family serine peptidase [Steroidobacteraceae bacterium]